MGAEAEAYELYSSENGALNADAELALGIFHSRKSYGQSSTTKAGDKDWQESYAKYGVSGWVESGEGSQRTYGALNWLSSATFGQGDAAGWTAGTERTTKIEDAYLGWKSGTSISALGKDGLDVSFGRQNIIVGDGFLLAGDALNIGKSFLDGSVNRGGAYYLTGRKAFDETAVIKVGGAEGLRSDLMWLKSDNPAQGKAEIVAGTLEHVNALGTVGLTYLKVVDTDPVYDLIDRDGSRTVSIRGQGNLGHPNLLLSGEYAKQHRNAGDENAWYLESGWTFSDTLWRPALSYRFSRFSEGYDPLFYGNVRAIGTWFQGEVASNYSGPFSTNTRIHQLGLTLTPSNSVSLGILAYRFETLSKTANAFANLDGKEFDLYAMWQLNEHLSTIPLVGIYKPEKDINNGGSQLNDSHTNIYAQILLQAKF
ncbi:alginate export family protein [Pseudomonas sp. Bi70]|uniref:alginate export family protein n=1 Tax=Pseudomonas sp. Bi70 TaxID=2821127 RepID=UPI001E47406C|nr:alginate export family protein [Pseudomonas sp. Bi70]